MRQRKKREQRAYCGKTPIILRLTQRIRIVGWDHYARYEWIPPGRSVSLNTVDRVVQVGSTGLEH